MIEALTPTLWFNVPLVIISLPKELFLAMKTGLLNFELVTFIELANSTITVPLFPLYPVKAPLTPFPPKAEKFPVKLNEFTA